MRNPNGYGSVVKLSGNRRNPFAVRKTTGFNEKGHPIYLIIGYVETREEGMILLANYNKSPWDIDTEKMTLAELFEMYKEKKMFKLGKSAQKSLKTGFNHTKTLHTMPYKNLKSYHMQEVIDGCGSGSSTQAQIKNLFNHLDNFGLELDVINRGYAQLLTTAPPPESSKVPFTNEEVALLWEHQETPWVDTVLILMYSGFRISELLDLRIENINLEEGTMKGGTKTASGKNRIVPIHSKIRHLVEARYDTKNEFLLVNSKGTKLIKETYYPHWKAVMKALNLSHTPHECRHTFRSRLDNVGANRVSINLIMGHKSSEIGERVYTHKTIDDLKKAIELVTD